MAENQLARSPESNIAQLIATQMSRIQRLIADPAMTRRFAQLALLEMRRTPKLFECNPQSILACLMNSASLGLQLGVGGQCYMIPYKGEATFVTGWKGYITLAGRQGSEAWTGAVRESDEFDYSDGSKPFIHHKRKADRDAKITHYWANGMASFAKHPVIDVWSKADMFAHRSRFNKVGDKHYSFSNPESEEAYGRKLPLLQVVKYLPMSYELEVAQQLDFAADRGEQKLRPADVEDGMLLPSIQGGDIQPVSDDDRGVEELAEKANINGANLQQLRQQYADRPNDLVKFLQNEATKKKQPSVLPSRSRQVQRPAASQAKPEDEPQAMPSDDPPAPAGFAFELNSQALPTNSGEDDGIGDGNF